MDVHLVPGQQHSDNRMVWLSSGAVVLQVLDACLIFGKTLNCCSQMLSILSDSISVILLRGQGKKCSFKCVARPFYKILRQGSGMQVHGTIFRFVFVTKIYEKYYFFLVYDDTLLT